MKNAIENLNRDLRLRITVIVPSGPVPFAYVSKMSLCPPNVLDPKAATRLLEISEPAATELFEKARLARRKDNEVESIQRVLSSPREFDGQFWQAMKAETMPSKYITYLMRELAAASTGEFIKSIDALIKSSDTPTAFLESLKQLSSATAKESLDLRALPLKNNRVESFSGQQNTIPAFALKLLKRVANLKVLYLTERRDPIGKREAEQLWS